MKIDKIVTPVPSQQNNNKTKKLNTAATVALPTVAIASGFLVADAFGNSKKVYQSAVAEAKRAYDETYLVDADNFTERMNIKRLIKADELDFVELNASRAEKLKYKNTIDLLKNLRKIHIYRGLTWSAIAGIATSAGVFVYKKFKSNDANQPPKTPQEQTKTKNMLKTLGTMLAPTVALPTAFLLFDSFGNSKISFLNALYSINEKMFEEIRNKNFDDMLNIVNNGGYLNDDNVPEIIARNNNSVKAKYSGAIDITRQLRRSNILTGSRIAAGIGLSLGCLYLAVKGQLQKKNQKQLKTEPTKAEYLKSNNQNLMKPVSFKGNTQVSFKGVVEYLEKFIEDKDYIEEVRAMVEGEDPSIDEAFFVMDTLELALSDWPIGAQDHDLTGKMPRTLAEYHDAIVDDLFPVPDAPKNPIPGLFALKKTRESLLNAFGDYLKAAIPNERFKSLLRNARAVKFAEEKEEYEEKAAEQLSLFCVKYQISQEFLSLLNGKTKGVKIPNSVVIQSGDSDKADETIKWIVAKSDANFIHLDYNSEDTHERLIKKIYSALEIAAENHKKDSKHTLILVDAFDSLIWRPYAEEHIIGDVKNMLDKVSKQYNATILYTCECTEVLDSIVLQAHRAKVFDIDKQESSEKMRKIQQEYMKEGLTKLKDVFGYSFVYDFFGSDTVNLYLANNNKDVSCLWVDSSDIKVIRSVIENLDMIKEVAPMFQLVTSIQFPEPNSFEGLNSEYCYRRSNYTADHRAIYQYYIPSK